MFLCFKTGDNEASFENKMPCEGRGRGMLPGVFQPGWQRGETLSLRSHMCINSLHKKADDKPETHTIKKTFKFKLANANAQCQINTKELERLSVYLACLEINYFK